MTGRELFRRLSDLYKEYSDMRKKLDSLAEEITKLEQVEFNIPMEEAEGEIESDPFDKCIEGWEGSREQKENNKQGVIVFEELLSNMIKEVPSLLRHVGERRKEDDE